MLCQSKRSVRGSRWRWRWRILTVVVGVDGCDCLDVSPLFDDVVAADADEEDGDEEGHQDDP